MNRRNRFLEDARLELTKAEDEIAQNEQLLIRRLEEQANSVFTALVPGIVKNIRVTTVGGVLGPGEELMQIVPVEDELLIESRVSPADIARVAPGLVANIRFDPFDYTIYGAAAGKSRLRQRRHAERGIRARNAGVLPRARQAGQLLPFEPPPADSSRSSPG